uniref:Uncharacterized protein n=1 Tax=Arundo donax TaxID=35708 RepID=A0A0A9FQC4_ARUDO
MERKKNTAGYFILNNITKSSYKLIPQASLVTINNEFS